MTRGGPRAADYPSPGDVRAAQPTAAARPFLKWAGGKRQLLPQLLERVPERFGRYHEPFVGGGALFFALASERLGFSAALYDSNDRLMRTYRAVRDDTSRVVSLLRAARHQREEFEEARALDVDSCAGAECAAWMIYLNKCCFNGLYRVNRAGRFNVPFGKFKTPPTILDEGNLRACGAVLRLSAVELHATDFGEVDARARRGDFVYLDPPYVPLTATSSFTSYTADGFDMADHVRLRDLALRLKRRGVHVLLSNSSAPAVRELYGRRGEFVVEEVQARRSVNSRAEGRGKIAEVLIR